MTHLTDTTTTHDHDRRGEPVAVNHLTVVPIRHGRRTVGAYVMTPQGIRFQPATDVTRIVVTALTTAALTAVVIAIAIAIAVRRPSAIRAVTMGPGGWVSLKGMPAPPMRSAAAPARPWWACALRAHRLVAER
ncbi:hypothetical protein [Actinoplanes xinjiangensis]|uniref:Uncharacterized protein n=1 Tax=Actinoplanes xinjiangensis TaxID=512350 RepID=A0A316E7L7_9ACTN|nr:hypothetical protein [Actinoplanes xinjiangensis]PWK26444.1 hypothetical protein BC793_1649 [Actinoplanes xinjiangensis]GIF45241.1 hypothetical protein Axi01nite_95520 [Actinoplanes xinjiangensis]